MRKKAILLAAVCMLTASLAQASDRGLVISKINAEYYAENIEEAVSKIERIDKDARDDEYFKQVFECLDDYSVYYTKSEYEKLVSEYETQSITAALYNDRIEMKINRFTQGTDEKFKEYEDICREKNVKRLVLDLAECSGGYLTVMNEIAGDLVPEGKILTAKFKNGEKIYYSELRDPWFDEIEVNISSHTASAAEILAAALKESGAAKIRGVNSCGKTSIQSMYRLESGAAFKITCGKYFTRDGKDITGCGLSPDFTEYRYPVKIRWNSYCKAIFEKR